MKVMTYNIQNDYKLFNNNIIKNKAKDIVSLIEKYDIDIVGFQELGDRQVGLYKKLLDNYTFIGEHRHSGFLSNEYTALFIKKDIKINGFKTYSLSDNCERLGTKLANHNYPRICSLCHITYEKQNYLVINLHLDNSNDDNRGEELEILNNIINKERKKEHLIIMGDFNMGETKYLKSFIKKYNLKNCTIHLGNTYINSKMILDHILISNTLNCDYKEKLLVNSSDHYPLVTSVSNK